MIKTTAGVLLLAILLAVLFLNTHITLLGSGFLIGDGTHVLTYHGLVKEAEKLKIKFPNELDNPNNPTKRDIVLPKCWQQ